MLLGVLVLSAALVDAQSLPPDASSLPTATGNVRGRITAVDADNPIRNARVSLIGDAFVAPVLTDVEGRFAVTSVPAGRYAVSAMKTGYATETYRAKGPQQASRIEVAPGETIEGIDIRLARSAAITGRVLDDLGQPLPLVTIVAERIVRSGGRVEFMKESSAETDDTGVYRVPGLPAGEFVVATAGGRLAFNPGGIAVLPPDPGSFKYYPNGSTRERAQPIALGPGDEASPCRCRRQPHRPWPDRQHPA
jgi:hypothetical protein